VREPEAGGENWRLGVADEDEASTRPKCPRDRSNEEILVNSNEVSEGSKAYGECERPHKREVTRVGTNEMDRWITGRLPNPPSSLHEHPGAEVDTHYMAVAASAESPNPSARPAADIDGIIDLSDNR